MRSSKWVRRTLTLMVCFAMVAPNSLAADPIFSDTSRPGQVAFVPFLSTADFLDACVNSVAHFHSLLRKEAYDAKVIALNNPTATDMGFSLENEVQAALKPLLAKAKATNPQKFQGIVSSIISSGTKTGFGRTLQTVSPVFPTLLGLVGNLTVQEKKISREDLDSFITATAKYFQQYERLHTANNLLESHLERLSSRMRDLQYDLREYMLDMIVILHKSQQRTPLKSLSLEELLLRYLDRTKVDALLATAGTGSLHYPADGIKGAKDLAGGLQKLFQDYQRVYTDNYNQVRTILSEAKRLGKNVNAAQVDASLKELETLYNDSRNADVLSLRLTTLQERLKVLAASEQRVVTR